MSVSVPPDPRRLPDGRIADVPVRAESDDGVIGDGFATLAPGDPDFDKWDRWLRQQEGTHEHE